MAEIDSENDECGESACFAHLICPECGVVFDGAKHLPGCTWVDATRGGDATDRFEPAPKD
jgi:hypothetical protein